MLDAVIPLFTGIVIAAVSAYVTVQLSLRRFRSERWWEKKADAYERVIAALHDSAAYSVNQLDAHASGHELPEKENEELISRSKAAYEEILRAIDLGAFLLSEKALSRLKEYTQDRNKALKMDFLVEYLDDDSKAAKRCLDDFISIARLDLGIKK